MHSRYWQNKDLSIEIEIHDASEKVIDSTKVIKIKLHSASWVITPKSPNEIFIEYTFVADAKGSVPKWLVHKYSLKSIWKTLNNLQQQLPISPYQKMHVDGIIEMEL